MSDEAGINRNIRHFRKQIILWKDYPDIVWAMRRGLSREFEKLADLKYRPISATKVLAHKTKDGKMDINDLDKKVAKELANNCDTGDSELDHVVADKYLVDVIFALGLTETAIEYKRLKANFWCA